MRDNRKAEWPSFSSLNLAACLPKLVHFETLNVQFSEVHCSKALIKIGKCLHNARQHSKEIPKWNFLEIVIFNIVRERRPLPPPPPPRKLDIFH